MRDAPAFFADAACRGYDPNLFFTEDARREAVALAVCERCPVRVACLDHALRVGEEHGTYGGVTERKRRAVRRAWLARQGRERRSA